MPGSHAALPLIAEEPGFRHRMEAKEDPLHRFDAAQAYAAGQRAYQAIFATGLPSHARLGQELSKASAAARAALDQGERVVITAGERQIQVFEPEPGAVLAACLRRGFAAAGRVTPAMLDAAQSFLPNVDREALRLAIEGALTQETAR